MLPISVLTCTPISSQGGDALGRIRQGALLEDDVGVDRLALDGVRVPDDRLSATAGCDRWRPRSRRSEAVAADVDHVVDPPNDAVHPVGIAPGTVAGGTSLKALK